MENATAQARDILIAAVAEEAKNHLLKAVESVDFREAAKEILDETCDVLDFESINIAIMDWFSGVLAGL